MLSDFVKYVKQYWHDRPDKSTPLNAERMNHIENGIEANANAIDEIAKAVVSNIVNDPNKIASMAAVYALQEKLGTGDLPSDTSDVISAISALNSNLLSLSLKTFTVDVTEKSSFDGKYYMEKKISTESWYSSAKAIIPLYARKSGDTYICIVEVERDTLRVQADKSISGVSVGIMVVS